MAKRKEKEDVALGPSLAKLLRSVARDMMGVYRPERHYMRGPGPKWHEKHAQASQPEPVTLQPSKAAV